MPSALSNSEAHDIVVRAWTAVHGREPTDDEARYTQAIALLETGYGRAGQFGRFLDDNGGYNWGALERRRNADGTCPAGTLPGSDAGNSRCFYVFPDDVSAAKAFIKNLTVSFPARAANILTAMNGGTPEDVAEAMKNPPSVAYYEAPSATYAKGIRNALANLGAGVPGNSSSVGSKSLLLLAIVGGSAYAAYQYGLLDGAISWIRRQV